MRRDRSLVEEVKYQLRYALPLCLVCLLTNWWSDNAITIRIRGILFSWFLGKCGKNFTVGRDVTILDGDRLTVGDNVYFAKGSWLNATGGLEIEDEVMLGPYVVVATSKHSFKNGSVRFGGYRCMPVRIGRGSWLGAHVVVSGGVNIGRGNLIGANAVVTKDTPDNVLVGGVPAKVIRERENNSDGCKIET